MVSPWQAGTVHWCSSAPSTVTGISSEWMNISTNQSSMNKSENFFQPLWPPLSESHSILNYSCPNFPVNPAAHWQFKWERQISYDITYMWNLKKEYKWAYLQNRKRPVKTWLLGGKGGRINWEIGINIYTLLYIK